MNTPRIGQPLSRQPLEDSLCAQLYLDGSGLKALARLYHRSTNDIRTYLTSQNIQIRPQGHNPRRQQDTT